MTDASATGRTPADARIARLVQLYDTLSRCSDAIQRCRTREELAQRVCEIVVERAGFLRAWSGFLDDGQRNLMPVASAGEGATAEWVRNLHVTVDPDLATSHGPTGTAIREGEAQWWQNVGEDPRTALWRDTAIQAGVTAVAALPLRCHGRVVGSLTLCAGGVSAQFDEESRALIGRVAEQVGSALEAYEREEARSAVERNLKEARDAYVDLLATTQDGFLLVDTGGRILDVNARYSQMSGYTRDELLTMCVADLEAVDPPSTTAARIQALTREGYGRFEGVHRRKDGSVWSIEGTTTYRNINGGQFQTFLRDITEQQRTTAERRLQSAALNAAVDGIIITDVSGTILWVNASFIRLTGYDRGDLLGHSIEDFRPPTHSEAFLNELWSTILGGNAWSGEILSSRKDGTVFTSSVSITPVMDAAGQCSHFVGVLRDVSDAKRLQAQFLHSQKMEVVGRLAGSIAHDFNNLLGVINGTAELARLELDQGSPLRADLELIRHTGDKAAILTRRLLAFSRRQVVDPQTLDLNDFVRDSHRVLQRLVGELVTIDVQPHATRATVVGDAGQLEQVLLNLVVNGRDAMPEGGRITIETRDGDDDVLLVVTDTGAGIDPAIRNHIFEPFFTTKDASKGTGLGLPTVLYIVEDAGGGIDVESEVGHGTAFTIRWPRAAGAPATTVATATPALATILVVEDDEPFLDVAARMLRRGGYEVLTARSVEEAEPLLADRGDDIRLVLADVILPGTSGLQLAERAQQAHPALNVLFMSGYPDTGLGAVTLKAIERRLIRKPFSSGQLLSMVRQSLGQSGARQGLSDRP